MFQAPVPGQSLTTTPKNAAYEREPEIVDPEEAIEYHMDLLAQPDRLNAILDMLEIGDGITVKAVTEGYPS